MIKKARARRIKAKKKTGQFLQFLQKTTCATCRKARNVMKRRGYRLRFRDIWQEPLSASELEKLIGNHDHTEFLNTKSKVYREENMKEEPPSRRKAISLIRRPIIVGGGRVVVGFDEQGRAKF